MKNVICLFVGASGIGKTTIANKLSEEKGWKVVESYTTRPKRYDKETGHIFVTDEDFHKCKTDACACTEFDGYRYWATNKQIDESDIYIIDPDGVDYFVKHYKGKSKPVSVKLYADEQTCGKRMEKRGDSKNKIKQRLKHDRHIFRRFHADADVSADSDDIADIAERVCDIICAAEQENERGTERRA